jgi:hypothetical protein
MEPSDGTYDLPNQAKSVASFILDRLGNESYEGVINFAYSTLPMVEILKEEELVGRTFLGRVLDMSKTGPVFKSTCKQKEEARRRLKAQQQESSRTDLKKMHDLELSKANDHVKEDCFAIKAGITYSEKGTL